jgi:hypothetical protein
MFEVGDVAAYTVRRTTMLGSKHQLVPGLLVQAMFEFEPSAGVVAIVVRFSHQGDISKVYYYDCEVLDRC